MVVLRSRAIGTPSPCPTFDPGKVVMGTGGVHSYADDRRFRDRLEYGHASQRSVSNENASPAASPVTQARVRRS